MWFLVSALSDPSSAPAASTSPLRTCSSVYYLWLREQPKMKRKMTSVHIPKKENHLARRTTCCPTLVPGKEEPKQSHSTFPSPASSQVNVFGFQFPVTRADKLLWKSWFPIATVVDVSGCQRLQHVPLTRSLLQLPVQLHSVLTPDRMQCRLASLPLSGRCERCEKM